MKIVLVNPYFRLIESFSGYIKELGSILPPYGLAILGSVLENEGMDVFIIDGWVENTSAGQLTEMILKRDPDVVGLYINTSAFYYSKIIAGLLRQKKEDLIIIAGGPHVTSVPEDTLRFIPALDFCVIGEGEYTLPALLKALPKIERIKSSPNGKKPDEESTNLWTIPRDENGTIIRGIATGTKEGIISTGPSPPIRNLDSIPHPAWHLLKMDKYRPTAANYLKLPCYSLLTSRGCPFNCSFCANPFGRNVRFHSAERVFEDVKILVEEFGAREIIFEDDCFTADKRRLYKLFDYFAKELPDFTWSCLTRVDTVDRNILEKMYAAGCWRVGYGVESGSDEILKKMNKLFTTADLMRVFRITKKIGLNIRAFFIIGWLFDTEETINMTAKFARKLNPDVAQFSFFVPYPGTRDYHYAVKHGLIDPYYYTKSPLGDYHNLERPVFVPKGMTPQRLKKLHAASVSSFYLSPKYIISRLKWLRRPRIFLSNLRIGLKVLPRLLKIKNAETIGNIPGTT